MSSIVVSVTISDDVDNSENRIERKAERRGNFYDYERWRDMEADGVHSSINACSQTVLSSIRSVVT